MGDPARWCVLYSQQGCYLGKRVFDYLPNIREVKFLEQVNPLTGIAWEISVSFPFQLDTTSWWSRINKFLLGERGKRALRFRVMDFI